MVSPPGLNQWLLSKAGPTTQEPLSSDIILVSLPFNASNKDHGALVFENDCITPFDDDSYFEVDTTTPSSNEPGGFIQFNTILKMNVTALSHSAYWNTLTEKTRGGWVETCVETYLTFTDELNLGNNDSQEKVNFKNNLLNITVSLTANFDVGGVDVQGGGDSTNSTENGANFDYSDFSNANGCKASNLGCVDRVDSRLARSVVSPAIGTVLLAGLLVAGYLIGRRNGRFTGDRSRNRNTPQYREVENEDRIFPVKEMHSSSNKISAINA